MSISIKAATKALAKTVMGRRCAKAAIAAALFSLFSTQGAAQGNGGAMPANCGQNPNQCSLSIWKANSFPHTGVTQSVTFSNRETLTCTSNGANKPRTCTLSGGKGTALNIGDPDTSRTPPANNGGDQQPDNQAGSTQANNQGADPLTGDAVSNLVSQVSAVRSGAPGSVQSCEEMSAQLASLNNANADLSTQTAKENRFFNAVLNLSPAQVDDLIAKRQAQLDKSNAPHRNWTPTSGQPQPPPYQDPELDWLLTYKTAQFAGIGMQDAKDEFLRQIDDMNKQAKANRAQIRDLQSQMANMGCGTNANTAANPTDIPPPPPFTTSDPAAPEYIPPP